MIGFASFVYTQNMTIVVRSIYSGAVYVNVLDAITHEPIEGENLVVSTTNGDVLSGDLISDA